MFKNVFNLFKNMLNILVVASDLDVDVFPCVFLMLVVLVVVVVVVVVVDSTSPI